MCKGKSESEKLQFNMKRLEKYRNVPKNRYFNM